MALACTKNELVTLMPSLHALSDTQLQWVILLGWAQRNGYTLPTDVGTIIAGAVCLRCMTPHEMLVAEATILLQEADSDGSELMEKVKCLPCSEPDLIKAMILWLKCQTFDS